MSRCACAMTAAVSCMAPAPIPTSSLRACRRTCARSTRSANEWRRVMKRTLFDKIWDAHVVAEEPGRPAVLYVDLHLVHEVTSPQAFAGLAERGLRVRRPDRTVATMDHS